jgi:hypothetical protein
MAGMLVLELGFLIESVPAKINESIAEVTHKIVLMKLKDQSFITHFYTTEYNGSFLTCHAHFSFSRHNTSHIFLSFQENWQWLCHPWSFSSSPYDS